MSNLRARGIFSLTYSWLPIIILFINLFPFKNLKDSLIGFKLFFFIYKNHFFIAGFFFIFDGISFLSTKIP